jgi:hypothetical protein
MINAGGGNETNNPVASRILKAGGRKAEAIRNYTLRIYLFNTDYSTVTPPAFDMPGDNGGPYCTPLWTAPPIVAIYPSGTVVAIEAFGDGYNPGFPDPPITWQFIYFTGDLTGGASPQNLTMNADKTVVACFSSSL